MIGAWRRSPRMPGRPRARERARTPWQQAAARKVRGIKRPAGGALYPAGSNEQDAGTRIARPRVLLAQLAARYSGTFFVDEDALGAPGGGPPPGPPIFLRW